MFLQSTYPRSTLSLLRTSHVTSPPNIDVLEKVMEKTFFDSSSLPDVMIGPALLQYIEEHFSRTDASIERVFSALQIAYMKHFQEPLTLLVHDELMGTSSPQRVEELLERPSSFPFVDALFTRILSVLQNNAPDRLTDVTARSMLKSVADARHQFREKLTGVHRAYSCLRLLQTWLASQGYKAYANATVGGKVPPALSVMRDALSGRVEKELKYLSMAVSKLRIGNLASLLPLLCDFFEDADEKIAASEKNTSSGLEDIIHELDSCIETQGSTDTNLDPTPPRDPHVSALAQSLSNLVYDFLHARLQPLDTQSTALWDIWYMGSTPFLSDVLDPAPRASILSALLHPHLYHLPTPSNARTRNELEKDARPTQDPVLQKVSLWQLSDTSILFWRYLEAGKMINVYDWYESFRQILDSQRENAATAGPATPRHERKHAETSGAGAENEKWAMETHARFMRALHELDLLGFIKHTGRKADHVVRTAYDQE